MHPGRMPDTTSATRSNATALAPPPGGAFSLVVVPGVSAALRPPANSCQASGLIAQNGKLNPPSLLSSRRILSCTRTHRLLGILPDIDAREEPSGFPDILAILLTEGLAHHLLFA